MRLLRTPPPPPTPYPSTTTRHRSYVAAERDASATSRLRGFLLACAHTHTHTRTRAHTHIHTRERTRTLRRYVPQSESPCELNKCEIEPSYDVPDAMLNRDRDEYEFELDSWGRWDTPSDFTEYYDLAENAEKNTGCAD